MSDTQVRANDLIAEANELQNAGDKLSAAPMYLEAVELFPPYATFALVAADSYAEAGHDERAAAAYRIVLADEPDHPDAKASLKKVEKRLKKAAKAKPANDGPITKSGFLFKRSRD